VLHVFLEQKLQEAVRAVLPDADLSRVLVRPAVDAKFGDYQSNALMSLAKERKMNPRQLATDVKAKLDVSEWCDKVEIAGAGFLNFTLKPSAIGKVLAGAASGEHLFFQKTTKPRTVVVDFSSPNVAKPMHVGHIRSTILGDSLARVLRLLGHRVVTDNHIGDWGTQFGKLLVGWKKHLDKAALEKDAIAELERLYKLVNSASEQDPAVLDEARRELVKLQSGDEENLKIWREMIALSETQFERVYKRLGVNFDYTYGESYYNPMLKGVIEDLTKSSLAKQSEGALIVSFEDVPELKEHPALVQKSDGGFNYTTTDLATLQFRMEGGTWGAKPDEIVYVTDGRQQLHFRQIFTAFRKWHPEMQVKLAHVWFGSILGEDGKPFKTRSGDTVKLEDLLDEAEERAFKVVSEKNKELTEETRLEIARVVGLGAIKYADLSQNRQSDYVFSWDKMLSLQGNTAPYLQYVYTRVRSIFRKGGLEHVTGAGGDIVLSTPEEMAIAKHLLNFGLVLEAVADDYRPNFLCTYLYDLAAHFGRFYEKCPVLDAEGAQRAARLALCEVISKVIKQGLEVLGIEVTETM
jgi:arginyl-tRNA synthetase